MTVLSLTLSTIYCTVNTCMSGFVFERDSKSEKKRKKEGEREMEKGTMVKKRESRRVGMYVVRHFHTKCTCVPAATACLDQPAG